MKSFVGTINATAHNGLYCNADAASKKAVSIEEHSDIVAALVCADQQLGTRCGKLTLRDNAISCKRSVTTSILCGPFSLLQKYNK